MSRPKRYRRTPLTQQEKVASALAEAAYTGDLRLSGLELTAVPQAAF